MSILDRFPMNGWKSVIGATITMLSVAVPALAQEPRRWDIAGAAFGAWLAALGIVHKAEKAGTLSSSRGTHALIEVETAARPAAGAALLLSAALLSGCGTVPGSGAASAGAPMPATNLAQTARDQAAVPGQAYGGHVYWNFASATPGEVTMAVIEYAQKTNASLKDLTEALKATNGAPEVVTITTEGSVQGGDADNAGAGTSGASSLSGSGSLGRPQ